MASGLAINFTAIMPSNPFLSESPWLLRLLYRLPTCLASQHHFAPNEREHSQRRFSQAPQASARISLGCRGARACALAKCWHRRDITLPDLLVETLREFRKERLEIRLKLGAESPA
jgi:hypothetical protein